MAIAQKIKSTVKILKYKTSNLVNFWRFFTFLLLCLQNYCAVLAQVQDIPASSNNIVNNYSFEELENCPQGYGAIDQASGWIAVNFTPDLFHECATDPRVSVPQNYFGTQKPSEGKGYAGILLYHERSPLEFIATNFTEPMVKGEKYNLSFKISWARVYSNYACNGIGVLFTNNVSEALEITTPDLVINDLITDHKGWVTISKTIIADDNYDFIVIGNFKGKEKTKTYQFQRTGYPGAYYYIDEVKVEKFKEDEAQDFIKIYGKVLDANTQKPLDARIDYVLTDINYRAFEETNTSTGAYEFSSMQSASSFYLEVKTEGYFSQRIRIKEVKEKTVEQNFALMPMQVGNVMVWEDIFFNSNEAVLKKSSTPALKMLASFLQENPNFRIEIAGHTDNQGNETDNLALSRNRAQAVVNYLIEEGFISPKRLEAKGYGATNPLTSNDTEEGRQKNRRVEVKIIE